MKYIRTKYGISELCDEQHIEGFVAVKCPIQIKGYRVVSKENIIKQADTIKELCDEFVAIYKDENKSARVLETFGDYRQLDEKQLIYNLKNGWNIYGTIWTDKGLIYVAKMNNNGEFELL